MRRRLAACLATCAIRFAAGQDAGSALPSYVGSGTCLECHALGRPERPCSIEAIPAHEKSYRALAREEAEDIAVLTGTVDLPRESLLCLGCHATSTDLGPRWTRPSFDITAGVQCEACHGPGSLHAEARQHVRDGAEPPPPAGIQPGDREGCAACHRKRPSHDEVLQRGWRLPNTDRRYKTPVNLATSPDGSRLYVVCEHADSLVVLDPKAGSIVREVAVGRRPNDVAVSPDGKRLFVSNRFSRSLSVIDAASLQVVHEVPVGDDPHGVLANPSGDRIYVLNTGENSISVIDARSFREVRHMASGNGPWSLALRPDQRSIAVTSVRPLVCGLGEPHRSEVTVVSTGDDLVTQRVMVADANMLEGVTSVPGRDVVLFTLMRTKNLVPITRLAQGWVVTNGLGVLSGDGRLDQVLLDEPNRAFPDPVDVAASPDGRLAAVTSGGADEVVIVDIEALLDAISSSTPESRAEILPNHLGTSSRFVKRRIQVGANPRGVVFSPDGRFVYVAEALDDSVAVLDARSSSLVRRIGLGGPAKVTALRAGERLFHDARRTQGRQFSCRSCHPDGHVDGLSFDIEADGLGLHPVDNRSLRGIFDTAPFKWEGTNPTLDRQCGPRFAVFFTRLDPFTPVELDALVRYVSTIERPSNPHRAPDGLNLQQRLGKAVFDRVATNTGREIPRVKRCSTCHDGAYRSAASIQNVGTTMWFDAPLDLSEMDLHDDYSYGPLGAAYFQDLVSIDRSFDVPHLTNVYSSPPYLHNGAAASLEEIWTRYNLYERHGTTHDLTRRQLNDLVAYLMTL
jgi:YVTN family beta-propeller protein